MPFCSVKPSFGPSPLSDKNFKYNNGLCVSLLKGRKQPFQGYFNLSFRHGKKSVGAEYSQKLREVFSFLGAKLSLIFGINFVDCARHRYPDIICACGLRVHAITMM
jgi:hypothetical protein